MSLRHTLVTSSLRMLVSLVFRVHDEALRQVPMQGPLILVCNHVHVWEIPANYTHLMPRRTIGMVLAKRWENPFFRYIVVTVDAGNFFDDIRLAGEALADIQTVIRGGHQQAFLTGWLAGEFQPFQHGADLFQRERDSQPAPHILSGDFNRRVFGRQRVCIH